MNHVDKMLSDNIKLDFFQDDIPLISEHEREDGKIEVRRKGTLQLLDAWVREFYHTDDWEFWDTSIKTFKKVRKLRQKPAHAIKQNEFNQKYFHQQRDLIISAYDAVRNLRMMIENHPLARLAVCRKKKFWTLIALISLIKAP